MDRRLIIIAFILLLFTPQTFAATYYVANGGNDEAAGTAEAPWETVAQAISTDVQEGDIVYFNSGDTWTVSGEAPFTTRTGVTYDGKYWGDGTRATIKYPSGSTAYPVVMINGTPANTANRSIFRGFNVDITGGKASGIGIGVNATASYVTVDDCVVHDIDSTGVVFNYAILAGYGAGDISEVIVENCTLYNIPQEILCAYVTENGSVRSTIFRHNTIYTGGLSNSYSGWGAGIEVKNDVDGLIIEYNTIYDNNYAGIHIHHAEYGTPTNITIRYNIIHTNVCGIHWQGGGGTHYVYGNLFYANGYHAHDVITSVDADINLPNTGTFYVYNNSIHRSIAADSSGGAIHVGSGGTVEVKNNAIYSSAAPGYYDSSSVATHSDNMIYRTESGTAATDGASNYTSASITNWDETALGSDPTFTGGTLPTGFSGTYGTNLVPNQTYFAITTGDALANGATLGSPYNGSINQAGLTTPILRPVGGYDIGAYQYAASSPSHPLHKFTGATQNTASGATATWE